MELELAGLEQKLATLLADYHRLRAENDAMRRDLGRAQERNRALNARIAAATTRLDAVLQRLPEQNT
jgi:cell division septum initiation protein DivIVA